LTMLADIQMSSPYHPSLALNGGGFPEGFSCHHLDPIRCIVRGALHQPYSAWQARPHRDQQEHTGYSYNYLNTLSYATLCRTLTHNLNRRVFLRPVQDFVEIFSKLRVIPSSLDQFVKLVYNQCFLVESNHSPPNIDRVVITGIDSASSFFRRSSRFGKCRQIGS